MQRLSQLRRGRNLQSRAKRARLRRRQPRYAANLLRSDFRAPPRVMRPRQPYLGAKANIAELVG